MTDEQFRFLSEIVDLSPRAPSADITFDSRVVEDLGLDSLAVLELTTMLLGRFGRTAGVDRLITSDWNGVTVADVWRACVS